LARRRAIQKSASLVVADRFAPGLRETGKLLFGCLCEQVGQVFVTDTYVRTGLECVEKLECSW
jgi:hypothetical protein